MMERKKDKARQEIILKPKETCPNCGTLLDPAKDFCPKCGYRKGSYVPSDIFISPVEQRAITRGAGVLPILSFIFSILGPLLLGIGWLAGIFLGIVSLSVIRKKGGFAQDRKFALSGIIIGLLWFIIISLSGTYYFYHWRTNKIIAINEKGAIIALKNIAIAEKFVKSSFYSDKDLNGIAGYIALKDLDNLKWKIQGYKIDMLQFNEENFICEAIPNEYGRTGKRSFMIAADGFIRGSDIGGASTVDKGRELQVLFQGKSVFIDYNEEIAGRLLRLAEKIAKEGNYKKSKLIIDEIRTNYPLTEVQERLDSLNSSVEPFIISFRSKELYEEAWKEIESENLIRAKNILQEICDKYPTCEIISSVESDLAQLNFKIDVKLSQEAKVLFEQVKLDHQAGRYEEAIKKCTQIAKMYPDSQYVQKNAGLLEKMIEQGEEKLAEKLLKQIMDADIEKDFIETENVIDLLQSVYKNTDIYRENKDRIDNIMKNCIAHSLFHQFLDEKQQDKYRLALTYLERAIEVSPNIKAEAKEFLPELYAEVGNRYFNENDYLTACECYEKSISLNPSVILIDKDKLKKAFYELGRIFCEKNDYIGCKDRLMGMDAYFQDDKKINYFLANACIKTADYDNAVKHYSICHSLDNSTLDYLRRRGIAHIALALKLEKELAGRKTIDAMEGTNKILLEVTGIIAEINEKVGELKPLLVLGSNEREITKLNLTKEKALGDFVIRRNAISKRVMEYHKNDMEVLGALKSLRKELKDANADLKKSVDSTANSGLKETASKVDEKLILIIKAYKIGFKPIQKLDTIREEIIQRLYNAIKNFQKEFMTTTTTSDLYYRLTEKLTQTSTDIIKCWDAIYTSQNIAIDIEKFISKLD